jgi:hypothetical protein
MIEFFLNHAPTISAIVAITALFRPEISNLLKFIFSDIDFFPIKFLEVGFFDYGPTLTIEGVMHSRLSSQFVKEIRLTLTRINDKKTHKFVWWAFREAEFPNTTNTKFKSASAFSIKYDEKRDIVFCDEETKKKYMDELLKLRNSFQEYLHKNIKTTSQNEHEVLLQNFRSEHKSTITDLYAKIMKTFYWEPGKYKINFQIIAHKPNKIFSYSYSFSLSEEESKKLELNVIGLIEAALHKEWLPNFVHPILETNN